MHPRCLLLNLLYDRVLWVLRLVLLEVHTNVNKFINYCILHSLSAKVIQVNAIFFCCNRNAIAKQVITVIGVLSCWGFTLISFFFSVFVAVGCFFNAAVTYTRPLNPFAHSSSSFCHWSMPNQFSIIWVQHSNLYTIHEYETTKQRLTSS